MDSREAAPTLIAHWMDQETFYVDFGPCIPGREIASIDAVNSDIPGVTIASQTILTVDTTVATGEETEHVIPANKGISFRISGLLPRRLYTFVAAVILNDGPATRKAVDLPLQT